MTNTNIISGFRACGIHPFNPDAVPQEAYIPSSLYSNMNTPLPGCSQQPNDENQQSGSSGPQLMTSSASPPGRSTVVAVHKPTSAMTMTSLQAAVPLQAAIGFAEEGNEVSAETALSNSFCLSDYVPDDSQIITAVDTVTPPEIALDLCESSLLPKQLECYKYCLSNQFDLTTDAAFMAWKNLKQQCENSLSEIDATVSVIDLGLTVTDLGEANLVFENDAGVLSVSEDLSLAEPVCSDQPAAISNSDNVSTHEINVSFQNSSYPGDPDSDILSYPAPVIKKKKTAQRQKFFLLTSNEAREAKLKEIQEKAIQEEKKKANQEARLKKQQEKLNSERRNRPKKQNEPRNHQQELQENRQPKRNRTQKKTPRPTAECVKTRKVGIRKQKLAEDLTPCTACSTRYCDTADQSWIQCQECEAWYHNACQGLDEKGPRSFVCISCDE